MTIDRKVTAAGEVRWRARIRTPQGRRSRTFSRRTDAQRWLTEQRRALDRGDWTDPHAGRVTVRDWAERWHAGQAAHLRASTLAAQRSYLDTHILPRWGDVALAAVDHASAQEWVAELTQTLRPETVRKVARTLSAMLTDAARARLIPADPTAGLRLPRIERDEMRILTPDEVDRLADAIDQRYATLVWAAAWGGLRIGELAALERGDVDPVRRQLRVTKAASEVSGHVTVGPPKTRAAVRTVTVPGWVTQRIAAHTATHSSELVWPSPAGRGPISRTRWRQRQWLPAVREAGLEPLRIHDLRHTAVSLWIASGASPKEVAARAGHTSTSVVLDRYGHLYDDADARVADRLEQMHAPSPTTPGHVVPLTGVGPQWVPGPSSTPGDEEAPGVESGG